MTRKSWDEYFMDMARNAATRATCDRKHVGCVFVDSDRHMVASGYNGSIRGTDHCEEVGHLMDDGHCVRTVHAEINAIVQAAKTGARLKGTTVYVTASPCWNCFKAIANVGVSKIVFDEFYRDDRLFDVCKQIGIEVVHLQKESK